MKYKKIPRNLIKQWFVDKLQIDLDSEKLEDICSKIDNETKINYNRCCKSDSELLDADFVIIVGKEAHFYKDGKIIKKEALKFSD
tara:strand:- start:51 stop:305 length:255 start_codon:yes stop_codon:yes gene_type:complete